MRNVERNREINEKLKVSDVSNANKTELQINLTNGTM